jgi:hypothetical protein
MTTSKLVRLGGLALIIGAALSLLASIFDALTIGDRALSQVATQPGYLALSLLFLLTTLLILLGVIGLYARQANSAGALGLIAFIVAMAGIMMISGAGWAFAFVAPSLAPVAPEWLDADLSGGPIDLGLFLSFTLAPLGLVLMGVSSAVSKAIPAWAAWALVIGAAVSFAMDIAEVSIIGDVLFAAGAIAAGYALWSEKLMTPTTPSM